MVFNVGKLTEYLWADRNELIKRKINASGENGIIARPMTLSFERSLGRRPGEA